MAGTIKGITVEIGGNTAPLQKALQDVNKTSRDLNSELKNVEKLLKFDPENTVLLAQKQDILTEAVSNTTEKLDTLREAEKKVQEQVEEGKVSQEQYRAFQREVAKTEQELKKQTSALEDTTGKLDEFEKSSDKATDSTEDFNEAQKETSGQSSGLGMQINDLAGKMGIQLPQGATQALNGMQGMTAGFAVAATAAIAVAKAVYEIIKALAELTIEQAKRADDLYTESLISGIDFETLQAIEYASELIDVSTNTITSSMAKLTRNMENARKGSGDAADAFRKLGVRIENTDGSMRDAEDVFWDTIAALGEIDNEAERDALAMQVMSRSAMELNPLIKQGADVMRGYIEQAREKWVLDEEQAQSLLNLSDALAIYDNNVTHAKDLIAAEFAPALQKLLEVGGELLVKLSELAAESGAVDLFAAIVDVVSAAAQAFGPFIELISPLLESKIKPLAMGFGLLADAITIVVSGIEGLIESLKALVNGNYNMSFDWLDRLNGVFNGNSSFMRAAGNNAAGTDYWRGGETWVGEQGPERIFLPKGTRILSTRQSMESISGGDTYNITIPASDVREFNDIVRIAQNQRISMRAGYARG